MQRRRWKEVDRVGRKHPRAVVEEVEGRGSKQVARVHWSLKDYNFDANRVGYVRRNRTLVSGKRPQVCIATTGEARYGLRAGDITGVKATLRNREARRFRSYLQSRSGKGRKVARERRVDSLGLHVGKRKIGSGIVVSR
jgi:hypothetical protein